MSKFGEEKTTDGRGRSNRWMILCGIGLWVLLLGLEEISILALSINNFGNDFTQYWSGATSIAASHSPYHWLSESRGVDVHDFHYPPLLAVLLAPLPWLMNFETARWAWLVASIFCIIIASILVWRTTGLASTKPRIIAVLPFLILIPQATGALGFGRLIPLLFLVIAGALAVDQAGRSFITGSLIAFGSSLQAFPGLLGGYLLLRRRWTAIIAAVAAALGLLVLTVLIVGWDAHWTYVTQVIPTQQAWIGGPFNVSIAGFFTRLLMNNTFTTPVVAADPVAQAAIGVSTVVLVATTAYTVYRVSSQDNGELIGYSAIVVLSLLLSPITGNDNLIIAVLPLAVAVARVQAKASHLRGHLLLAMVLITLPVELYDLLPIRLFMVTIFPSQSVHDLPWRIGLGNILISGPTFGLLVLWALLCRLGLRR